MAKAQDEFLFPFFYKDFISATIGWEDDEVGAYLRLLLYQWDNVYIPTEKGRLFRIAHSLQKNWDIVMPKFTEITLENGAKVYQNARLEEIREERKNFINSQTNNGRKGGRPEGKKTQTKPKRNPISYSNRDSIVINTYFSLIENGEKFKNLIYEFGQHRSKKGKPIYEDNAEALCKRLMKLSGSNFDVAQEIINNAMSNDWQGIFAIGESEIKTISPQKGGLSAKL